MKLSRALLIVLLLHVVAVSGIIAFNAIKTRENSFVPASSVNAEPKPSATAGPAIHTDGAKPQTAATQKENAPHDDPKSAHSPSKLSSKDDDHVNLTPFTDQPSSRNRGTTPGREAVAVKPVSSGKTYVVKKGDNPVTIAKKLKVPYDDLMALNHIDDPRKLRIGQKLLIPKTVKPKATNGKAANPRKNEVRRAKQQTRST